MIYSFTGPFGVDFSNPAKYCGDNISSGNWPCIGYGAAECFVVPCVRRNTASIREGTLHEKVTSVVTALSVNTSVWHDPSKLSVIEMKCVNSTERTYLRDVDHNVFNASTQWLVYNTSRVVYPPICDKCLYQGYSMDADSLQSFFRDVFSGDIGTITGSVGRGSSFLGGALFMDRAIRGATSPCSRSVPSSTTSPMP